MTAEKEDATLEITPYADTAGELRYFYTATYGDIIEIGWLQDGNQVSKTIGEFRDKVSKMDMYLQVRVNKIRER
jgi:hypothetical protein